MKIGSRRNLAIGATALFAVAGAGGAVAATQRTGNSERQAYVNDVAKRLNVTPSALTSAMKAALYDRVDAAVAAGRLTPARASTLKQRIAQSDTVPFGGGFGHRFGLRGVPGGVGAAAQYLGLTRATLRTDLAAGKSLAQIASTTPGKSLAGLKAALSTAAQRKLSAAVSAGRITSRQQQQILANLPGRIDALVQRSGMGARDGGLGLDLGGHRQGAGPAGTGAAG